VAAGLTRAVVARVRVPWLGGAPLASAVAMAVLCVAACGSSEGAPAPTVGGPTPQASLSGRIEGTVAAIRAALDAEGIRLSPPTIPYRPAEPPEVESAPRAVLQADVADPRAGYVTVYETGSAEDARRIGDAMASFLESGFGRTNYPLDARFSLGQVGSTLVFTWFSPERADDPGRAEMAFDAIAGVGQPIPVAP
jgi:hypothetical protein